MIEEGEVAVVVVLTAASGEEAARLAEMLVGARLSEPGRGKGRGERAAPKAPFTFALCPFPPLNSPRHSIHTKFV